MPRPKGRAPKSADVIALEGNRGHLSEAEIKARAAAEAATKPAPVRPKKPAWLSTYAAEAWDAHARELERLALLTKIDAGAFALAMESYALARQALEDLRPRTKTGAVDQRTKKLTTTEVDRVHGGMLKKHPSVAVYLQASGDYRRWCVEFGLTPSARLGLRPARGGGAPAGSGGEEGDDGDAFDLGY